MSSSDRKINYNLRPSKSIERKMILEVLKEVCPPGEAHKYRYVGFGSSFFTDFKTFHKGLNIKDMVSIESKKSNEDRVKFNKPYACIDIEIGFSKDVLPKLKWNKKNIVWLDYETGLKDYMFEDIETCARNFKPGSFIVITLRRDFGEISKREFEETFSSNLFSEFKNEDIEPSNSASTIYKMFINKIDDVLSETYAAYTKPGEKVIFKQVFDLTYKDDAKMYTFGGLFIADNEVERYESYNFNQYEFIGKKEKPYDVTFPIITNKEFHELCSLLPSTKSAFLKNDKICFIPSEHKESFFNAYKYYPSYIESLDL